MAKLWLLPALLVAACDSTPVVNDTLVVDLMGGYSDTLVRIEVDGREVFEDRVTSGGILATAGVTPVYVPGGLHRVRAVVEDGADAEVTVDTETVVTVVVGYDPDTGRVTLTPLDHPVFHR